MILIAGMLVDFAVAVVSAAAAVAAVAAAAAAADGLDQSFLLPV